MGEAQTMLASQYQSHLASEQRGFTLTGLTLAAASAAIATLVTNSKFENLSTFESKVILWFTVGLFLAASLSIASIWPQRISIPGNEPQNWLPEHWPEGRRTLKSAKLEQAKILQSQIHGNRKVAMRKAILQRASITCAFAVSLISAIAWINR